MLVLFHDVSMHLDLGDSRLCPVKWCNLGGGVMGGVERGGAVRVISVTGCVG